MITENQYLSALNLVRQYLKQINDELEFSKKENITISDLCAEIEMSTRLRNCLYRYAGNYREVGERDDAAFSRILVKDITQEKWRACRNCGGSTYIELYSIKHRLNIQ